MSNVRSPQRQQGAINGGAANTPTIASITSNGNHSNATTTMTAASPSGTIATIGYSDPELLLDTLDQHRRYSSTTTTTSDPSLSSSTTTTNYNDPDTTSTTDRPIFDPIEFLNRHYDSETVLAQQLPALRSSVIRRMDALNDRIANAIQRQSDTAVMTRRNIQEAKASCQALEHRILQVRDKAAMSEQAVLQITTDMKRLDCAKRHLQRTITTLKRLHMLVQAIEQLRIIHLATEFQKQKQTPILLGSPSTHTTITNPTIPAHPDFKNAAHLVHAIQQLMEYFEPYVVKVQPMQVLCNKVQIYQENLRYSLVLSFRIVFFGRTKALQLTESSTSNKSKQKAAVATLKTKEAIDAESAETIVNDNENSTMPPEVLEGGVLFIDALGETVRKEFIHNFCQDILGDYLKEFEPPSKEKKDAAVAAANSASAAAAATAPKPEEKRVSSFKKVVVAEPKPVEPPPPPKVPQTGLDVIDKRFTWFLNGPLFTLKSKFPQVFPLHWNIHATLVTMFLQLTRDHILALLDGPRRDPDASNATVLLKALQRTIVFEKDISAWLERECSVVFETPGTEAAAAAGKVVTKPLTGIASIAFQKYMGPYIRLEEQKMDEQLAQALEDRTVDTRGEHPVFISSTNLFVYIKGSITRCTALTKGYALFLLYRSFKRSLKSYAQILNTKLPQPTNTQSSGISFGAKQDKNQSAANASYNVPPGEEVTICHVISTCEYCAETMEALEDLIRDTIDTNYKEKIDMLSDQEQFHDTSARCIRILVSGLSNRLETALKEMSHTNWANWESVGEESAYVFLIHEQIESFIKTIKQLLPTSHFRNFCDKFAVAFANAYYDHLSRQKRISEPGTQQILLDLYNLKTLFLKLPVLEDTMAAGKKSVGAGASIAPAMYTKIVQKQFGRMETILKLVGTPLNLLIDNFKVQWPGGTANDLTVVMSLRGMKRADQASMLEKLGFDPVQAMKGATAGVTSATIVSEHVQLLQDQGSTVAAKVGSDLNTMRQKVDEFRKNFR